MEAQKDNANITLVILNFGAIWKGGHKRHTLVVLPPRKELRCSLYIRLGRFSVGLKGYEEENKRQNVQLRRVRTSLLPSKSNNY